MKEAMIEKLLSEMSVEDLCGQLLNYNIPASKTIEQLDEEFKATRPGGLFFGWNTTPERIVEMIPDLLDKISAMIEKKTGEKAE